MLSPVSPQMRNFEKGVSCPMVVRAMEKIIGEVEEETVIERIEDLLIKVWGKTEDISIILFLERGKMVIAVPRRSKRKVLIQWREALHIDENPRNCRIVKLNEKVMREFEGSILASSVVRYKEDEDENLEMDDEKKALWIISRTGYRERIQRVMSETSGIGYLDGCTHSYVKVGSQGASINIKRGIFERMCLLRKQDLKGRADYLEKVCGIPEKDIDGRARKVRCDISVEDKNIKEKVKSLSKYIIQRKSADKDEMECLQKLAKQIATQGITKENMETLNSQWKKKEGDRAKGCPYRIGAYIPNAGILLQYTHARCKSEACGWFPLRFGRLQEGACTLNAVRDIDVDEFGCKVLGVPLRHFRPRLLCFLIHRGKKKVLNGEIYDLQALGKDEHNDIRNIPIYSIVGSYQQHRVNMDEKGKECGKEEKKTKGMSSLPVQMMTKSDRVIGKRNEEKAEINLKQNDGKEEISSDGPGEEEERIEQDKRTKEDLGSKSLLISKGQHDSHNKERENQKEKENNVFMTPTIESPNPAPPNVIPVSEHTHPTSSSLESFNSDILEINEPAHTCDQDQEKNFSQNTAKTLEIEARDTVEGPEDNCQIEIEPDIAKECFLKCVSFEDKNECTEHAKTDGDTYQHVLEATTNNASSDTVENRALQMSNEIENEPELQDADAENKTCTPLKKHVEEKCGTGIGESLLFCSNLESLTNEFWRENQKINESSPNTSKGDNMNTAMQNVSEENVKAVDEIQNVEHKNHNGTVEELSNIGTEKVSIDSNIDRSCHGRESAMLSTPKAIKPKVDVLENWNELRIVINLKNYEIAGKEIMIQIVAPSPSEARNHASQVPLGPSSESLEDLSLNRGASLRKGKERGEKEPESEKGQNHPTSCGSKNNIFEWALRMRDEEAKKTMYNSPGDESVEKRTDKNDLPVMIHRKGKIDIYNTGKKSEKIERVRVDAQSQWYDREWFKVFDKKEMFICEGPAERRISQRLKEKFVLTLASAEDSVIERLWFNLPMFLKHPNKRELDNMYLNSKMEGMSSEMIAETQFYKGAWGKAFKTLMGINKGQITISETDIEKLFPRSERTTDGSLEERIELGNVTRLITAKEVKLIVKKLPNGKAVSLSGGSYEIIKSVTGMKKGREGLARMYNHALLHSEEMHPQMYTSKCVGIPKKNGGVRPLCIQEAIIKPLHKIISMKIERVVREKIERTQKCLSQCEGQICAWEETMDILKEQNSPIMIQIDFSNAFGSIDRKYIIERLLYYKIPGEFIRYINSMLNRQRIVYRGDDGVDRIRDIDRGVPQGEPLSMLLFALGIDELLQDMENSEKTRVIAYADDVILIVKEEQDVEEVLNSFVERARERGLMVNMLKTKAGYRGSLNPTLKSFFKEKGIECIDVNEDALEYLGLPLTLNEDKKEEFVKDKVMEFIKQTKTLWKKGVTNQMKYHIQEMCLNSKMVYLFKALPLNKDKTKWMKEQQKKLDKIWKEHFGEQIKSWWRIPVRMYGLGLFNIIDRRKVARLNYENRRNTEEKSGKKEEPWRTYYKERIAKWVRKKKVQQVDFENLPPYINTSLLSPPHEYSMKLDNLAFKMMIETRYCTNGLDIYKEGTIGRRKCKCRLHNEPWTLQHVMSCPISAMQAVRSQHDQLTHYICGMLLRSHKVVNVVRERKTLEQQKRMKRGEETKRADVTYWMNGVQHSMDISVTTSWSKAKWRNPIADAEKRKEKEYNGEKNVHIILFDTSGGITGNAIRALNEIGMTSYDLRRLQTIIFRTDAKRYQVIYTTCKNEIYSRAKGKKKKGEMEKE